MIERILMEVLIKLLRKITITILFLVIYGNITIVNCQEINSNEIDKLVEKTMKVFEVPGIAVGIVKDGALIHSKGYGVRSLITKEAVTPNTLFGIASNSKAFTSASLGILIDEGKLNWDDKVIDFIPEFRLYNSYVTEEFTIRDLLTHRSGMGLGAGDLMIWPDGSDFTTNDIIHNLRYLKAISGFRTKYDYDNLLYIVAGEIIKRVSGISWESFVEERIMKVLGMNNSASSYNRLKDKSDVIDPHARIGGKVIPVDRTTGEIMNAAGGIYSSISDMSKWIIMQLNNGKFGENKDKQLFSEKVQHDMWSPQTIIPVRNKGHYNTNFSSYGLGWRLSNVKAFKEVSHTGGMAGMVTIVNLIPELNLGIMVFTNQQSSGAFMAICNTIKDYYLELENTDWVEKYSIAENNATGNADNITKKVWDEVFSNKDNKNIDFDKFTGTYKDNWFGEIIISNKDGRIWWESKRSKGLKGEMYYYKANTFVVKWTDRSMDADSFVLFELDYEGIPSGIKMKAISPITDFSYDFHDLNFYRIKTK